MVKNRTSTNFRFQWLPWSLVVGIWLWLCWPMVSGQTVVGFRDSAYLYYPLFEWIDEQWKSGEIPLWNPYCNLGMPIVGDGTPSLLYPGKLIFWCRFLSFPSRYGIYLAVHLLLASLGTYGLARVLRANTAGACLAAISYAFGGVVLFQVTNVIYLVSAAWLPLALACVWRMNKTSNPIWSIGAGTSCAMMILGGDPQMVYHVGLIAAATGARQFFRRFRRKTRLFHQSPENKNKTTNHLTNQPGSSATLRHSRAVGNPLRDHRITRSSAFRWAVNQVMLLALMVLVTIALSLVQLLPSYQWAQLSERTNSKQALNIFHVVGQWEFDSDGLQAARRALLGPAEPDTIADHAYQFSLPPWSLAELFWSNASGKICPTHQRWADVFPGAERVWFPSLYLGLLTVWLAIGGFRLTGWNRNSWLTRIAIFFTLASFGWYGIVWLANEILPAEHRLTELGPQVGGIYWLMLIGLPKYFSFRYPAKLFLVASLCICLLAGLRLRSWRKNISGDWSVFFGGFTTFGFVFVLMGLHDNFFARIPADGLFGPFDAIGATRGILFSLAHAGLVIGTAALLCRWAMNRPKSATAHRQFAMWAIVAITAIDLVVANRWLLVEIPAVAVTTATSRQQVLDQELFDRLSARESSAKRLGPVTMYRPRGAAFLPGGWSKSGSSTRLIEILNWQRETFYPKHHLGRNVRLVGSFSSIWPQEFESLLQEIENFDAAKKTSSKQVPTEQAADRRETADWKQSLCDVEVVDSKLPGEPSVGLNWSAAEPELVFLSDIDWPGPVAQSSEIGVSVRPPINPSALSRDNCKLTRFGINSLDLQVVVNRRQWIIHNSICDGNWQARVRNLATDEVRTLPLVSLQPGYQGFKLETGNYQITLAYQPHQFWLAAWVSGICWAMLVGGGLAIFVKRHRATAVERLTDCST